MYSTTLLDTEREGELLRSVTSGTYTPKKAASHSIYSTQKQLSSG